MLMAEGSYQLPWQVVANSFLNIKFPGKEEEKISKSRGTAIWIEEYLKTFDPDPLRYYLTAIAPESQRTAFDVDDFIQRNNRELLAALGNFVNRILTFNAKTFDNKVPPQGTLDDADKAQLELLRTFPAKVAEQLEQYRFKAALGEVMELTRQANAYVNVKQPWQQKKTDLAACGTTVNVCIQTIRCLMTLVQPFLPFSARKIATMLNLDEAAAFPWSQAAEQLPAGHTLGTPEVLFKKLEAKEIFAENNQA